MNVVVVEGVVGSEIAERVLPSGDRLVQWSVRVAGQDDERQQSVPVSWMGPPGRAPQPAAGEVVLVVGEVQRRFFRGGGGVTSRTEVRARQVLRRPAGRRRERVLGAVAGRLT